MYLTILDLILLFLLFLFVSFSFYMGFIAAVGSLLGVVVGTWAAGHFYAPVTEWLTPILLGNQNMASVVSFILIFTLVNRALGLAFWLVSKVLKPFSIIPFSKIINRILGAILGLVEGVLALGIALYFIERFNFSDWFANILASSQVASWLIWAGNILTPLLPEVVRAVQAVI